VESPVKNQHSVSKGKTGMAVEKKSIVIWCGAAPNQKALAVKLSKRFKISGIVIDEKKHVPVKKKLSDLPFLVWDRFRFRKISNGWKNLQHYYAGNFLSWPDTPVLRVAEINSKDTEDFTKNLQTDLIVVSGTGLIKERLLNIPVSLGIVNLHTGLSPYVKGGPNCTNWCIANNDWHLTGSTIMWMNAGIDSGNIITSEHIGINDAPDFFEAQKIVMEHAHSLYIRAIDYLLNSDPPYNSVIQSSLGKGKLFLTKMWTTDKKRALLKNWKSRKSIVKQPPPRSIKLPDNYK
jgi:Formyl transferase